MYHHMRQGMHPQVHLLQGSLHRMSGHQCGCACKCMQVLLTTAENKTVVSELIPQHGEKKVANIVNDLAKYKVCGCVHRTMSSAPSVYVYILTAVISCLTDRQHQHLLLLQEQPIQGCLVLQVFTSQTLLVDVDSGHCGRWGGMCCGCGVDVVSANVCLVPKKKEIIVLVNVLWWKLEMIIKLWWGSEQQL